MKARGCLIALAVCLGLMALGLALVGPALVREGGRLYEPIAKMKGAQEEFEAWSRAKGFEVPAEPSLSAEQLERFLNLRGRLEAAGEKNPMPVEGMRENEPPKLSDIQGLLEGAGEAVTGRMAAYREVGMTPEEYRYLEKLIYTLWLRPLRAEGSDPAAVSRVAKELNDLAAAEKDPAVSGRLKQLARTISAKRVPAPEGFKAEIHAVLMRRATEIDALRDVGASGTSSRHRVDF